MLTLTFLGVGSAFAKRNLHSNALVEAWTRGPQAQTKPDDTLLIDFGGTGPTALYQLKQKSGFTYLDRDGDINYPALRRLFITHLHADHIAGLEELASRNMHHFIDPHTRRGFRPKITSSPKVLDSLWQHSLGGGLSALPNHVATLADYFDVAAVHPRGQGSPDSFRLLDRYEFAPVPTDHIRIFAPFDWPSFGLLITDRSSGDSVLYSGDTRFNRDWSEGLMRPAKLIFHDVQLTDADDCVHALLSELRILPETIRSKMWLYHYGDQWDDPAYAFVADDFAGFVQPQTRYTLFA